LPTESTPDAWLRVEGLIDHSVGENSNDAAVRDAIETGESSAQNQLPILLNDDGMNDIVRPGSGIEGTIQKDPKGPNVQNAK
jgi:hypothetical protein